MTDEPLTAVSLFAGVGGFDLALERAGVRVVSAVEIDTAARGVLAHRFPTTTLFNDVSEVTGEQLLRAGFTPDRGIITGGFPCQDLSVAGRRAGLDGARSGLFWEIIRLVKETRPRWIILENVVGLLSSNCGRDMGTVVRALEELGYGVGWRVLDAQHFGVPQRRRRVFLVCHLGDEWSAPASILFEPEVSGGHSASRPSEGQDSSGNSQTRTRGHRRIGPDEAERLGRIPVLESDVVGTLAASDYKGVRNQMVGENKLIVVPIQDGRPVEKKQNGLGVGTDGDPSYTVDTTSAQSVAYISTFRKSRRAHTADDYESWVEDEQSNTLSVFDNTSETRATSLIVEPTRRDGARIYDEIAPTLQSFMGTGGGNVPLAAPSSSLSDFAVVRRLTPTECERLQGFPDGWTSHRLDEKKGLVEQKDAPRYKQIGNAVAVPVVEWIVSRLVAYEAGDL